MDLGLDGKRALVTASSKGLGFAVASALATEGASVVICGRDLGTLVDAEKQINSLKKGQCKAVQADLSQTDDVQRLLDTTHAYLGSVDILVTNTGGPPVGLFESITTKQWHQAYHDLIESTVQMLHSVLPGMKEQKWGRLLAITSVAVKQPVDELILSNSVRAAVVGLMKTLANEYGEHGITVNCILPGYILTDRMKKVALHQAKAKGIEEDKAFASLEAQIPMGRLGQPEEFGAMAAFLASERASYITGTSVPADGGYIRSLL